MQRNLSLQVDGKECNHGETAADVLVDCLTAFGVDVVFGLPGVRRIAGRSERAPVATFEQTKNLVEALARGTPYAGKIARNIALEKFRELV